MNNNQYPDVLYDEAGRVVRLCESLDFEGIVQHRPKAVSALQNVVRALDVRLPRLTPEAFSAPLAPKRPVEADASPVERRQSTAGAEERAELQLRRKQLVESLSRAGLGDRLGKVYSTLHAGRLQPFREVPHKMGLPACDMVLAPDFSPEGGLHAILISTQEVMSCVLPGGDSGRSWQVRQRAGYGSPEELADIVSLMSAGFPVS